MIKRLLLSRYKVITIKMWKDVLLKPKLGITGLLCDLTSILIALISLPYILNSLVVSLTLPLVNLLKVRGTFI